MTKGATSPRKGRVFFRIIPEQMIAAMPMKYAEVAIHAEPPKIAPATKAMKGTLAPQGMKVVVIMVMRLSRSFSIVLHAMTPGTPQPVPTSTGMNDFPESPKRLKTRSRINAIRAIYPHASRKARKMKRTSIWGTNPRTAPTPATIPSRIRPLSQGAHPTASRPPSIKTGIPGTHTPKSAGSGPSSPYFSERAFASERTSGVISMGSETSIVSSSTTT